MPAEEARPEFRRSDRARSPAAAGPCRPQSRDYGFHSASLERGRIAKRIPLASLGAASRVVLFLLIEQEVTEKTGS
jgi:hypothetical protein